MGLNYFTKLFFTAFEALEQSRLIFPEVPRNKAPKQKKATKAEKSHATVDITYGKGVWGLWKYSAPIGIALSILFYFSAPQAINIWGILYGLPITSYLTFYAFYRKRFKQHSKLLKAVGLIVILYAVFAPYFFYILVMSS